MKSLSNLITLLVIAALTLLAGPTSAATWYVDGTASGDGTSWAQGFETIAEAIADANAPDEIWVKAGTYAISSQMLVDEAIGIYGGFAGDETQRSQRDWANNATTIDGQNSVRILQISDESTIDGFTLVNGYYDTSTDTEFGGGAIYVAGSGGGDKTAHVSNCTISNNTIYANPIGTEGFMGGGAIYVGTGNPVFVNCLITNNTTNAYGGAANMYSGSPEFINCTISKNTALKGGGLYLQGVGTTLDAQLYNCIVSGNTGTIDANDLKVKLNGDPPQGNNNCSSVQIGTGTILTDPLFLDPDNDNYHLKAGSPCIDAGDNNSVPADITDDLDGRSRFINGTYADESPLPHVDIGAYEFGKLHCGNGDLPYPTGDINLDCGVDLIDYAIFTLCWLTNAEEPGWDPNCNLYDADSTIDIYDLDVLGENWLNFRLPQLVGYWKMDDDANNMVVLDSSFNGNHGTAQQDTEDISTAGIIDGALTFNGTSDYIDCGDVSNLDFGTGDFSICMWMKTSSSLAMRLVNKRDASNIGYEISTTTSGEIRAGIGDSSGYTQGFGGTVNDDAWHHVAITYDRDGSVSLYVDAGTPSTSDISIRPGSIDNSESFRIGRLAIPDKYFEGTIDDLRIFSRVLSADEIAVMNE